MPGNRKVSLVIPCYNEQEGLGEMLKNDLSFIDEILVVDNNSTDSTAEVALKNGCKLITERRQGYGAAYKAGFKYATGDIIVTMDGDNSYPLDEIPGLLQALTEGGLDFISACRLGRGRPESMSLTNYAGNRILTLIARVLFSWKIKDSQSGMWVFRREVLEKAKPKSNGMAFSEEIKIEAVRKGFRFAEVDIPYHERVGRTKLNKWKDGALNMVFLLYKRFC